MINSREYALKLLTIKDRTQKELCDKLREKGFNEDVIEEEIEFLKCYGYINDAGYAERYTNDAINIKKWGKIRIRAELIRKGIEREVVDRVIEEAFLEGDGEMLLSQMENRFKSADLSNIKERTRIFNFYLRRGFSAEEIKGAMNTLCSFRDIEDV